MNLKMQMKSSSWLKACTCMFTDCLVQGMLTYFIAECFVIFFAWGHFSSQSLDQTLRSLTWGSIFHHREIERFDYNCSSRTDTAAINQQRHVKFIQQNIPLCWSVRFSCLNVNLMDFQEKANSTHVNKMSGGKAKLVSFYEEFLRKQRQKQWQREWRMPQASLSSNFC